MFFALVFIDIRIGADDDEVAFLREAGGGAVDANDSGAALALDGVGRETLAVVDIQDIDLFVGDDVDFIEQVAVDGDRAFVMKVGLRDHGAVDLAFEHSNIHSGNTSIGYGNQVKRRDL